MQRGPAMITGALLINAGAICYLASVVAKGPSGETASVLSLLAAIAGFVLLARSLWADPVTGPECKRAVGSIVGLGAASKPTGSSANQIK